MKKYIRRFPRYKNLGTIWENIPGLDVSQVKPTQWLIDSLLPSGSIQLVYGSFGTRKTTALLLAASCVSRGVPFLGHETHRCPVLYLDYENPADVLKSYCDDLRIDLRSPFLSIWDRAGKPSIPVPGDRNSTTEKALDEFIDRCIQVTGYAPWLIFDSWTSLLKEEHAGNYTSDAAPIIRDIRRYRDAGATCTIIDHTGTSHKDRPAGTVAKQTQMDTQLAFHSKDASHNGGFGTSKILVKAFLKRYAPKGVGTFTFCVDSELRDEVWHATKLARTDDQADVKQERLVQIEHLKNIIRQNPKLKKTGLAHEAAEPINGKQIISINAARHLLDDGAQEELWTITKKNTFRLL